MGNGMNKVVPGVYVGNIRDAKDWKQIDEHNITHILSIHDNAKKLLPTLQYLCIQVGDHPSEDLIKYFPQCNDFIHNARLHGGNVLIHCLAGVSRSVTITCAYLMTVTNLSWRDSLNAVRGARRVANPNFGFQKQLQCFENDILSREKARFHLSHKSVSHKDEEICHRLLEAHERYVLYGDKADSMAENEYPLGHGQYSSKSSTSTSSSSANGGTSTSGGRSSSSAGSGGGSTAGHHHNSSSSSSNSSHHHSGHHRRDRTDSSSSTDNSARREKRRSRSSSSCDDTK